MSSYEELKECISACMNGRLDDVKRLVNNGLDINSTYEGFSLLWSCMSEGYLNVADWLIKNGANINQDRGLLGLIIQGEVDRFEYEKYELRNSEIKEPDSTNTEFFILNGIDINQIDIEGKTPLDRAIEYNHYKAEIFLRSKGAKTSEELEANNN